MMSDAAKGQIKHLLHLSDILARFLTFSSLQTTFCKTLIYFHVEFIPTTGELEFVRHVDDLDLYEDLQHNELL